jgi:hypothetical protein
MPAGFAGFPRDPTNDEPVGLMQAVRSLRKDKNDKKDSSSTDAAISSWKEKEAARESRQSVDTLPPYSEEKKSS